MQMSLNSLSTQALLQEIETAFPILEMPSTDSLVIHDASCPDCSDLLIDLESWRGQAITDDEIRLIHQNLSHLSPSTWRWILPHYLRFCLTPIAEYNRMETEFLVYALSPEPEFVEVTWNKLSLLSEKQLACLVWFFEWLANHHFWREYCPENIVSALRFLRTKR
jgi:hypothetical protein